MQKPKVYYAVNLIMESENPHLVKINKEILPKYAEIIPWFGTGPVDDMRTLYNMDIKAVESADLIIAEVSYPSHGVGMEVMHAVHVGKPILAIALEGKIVSRMLRGIDYKKFQFEWYKDYGDLERLLDNYFENFKIN
jgi:nucleoside 2-deoxyribosyltransferase